MKVAYPAAYDVSGTISLRAVTKIYRDERDGAIRHIGKIVR